MAAESAERPVGLAGPAGPVVKFGFFDDDDSSSELGRAQDVNGFADRDGSGPFWGSFDIVGCSLADRLAAARLGHGIGNVEMRILGDDGESVGCYYISGLLPTGRVANSRDGSLVDVSCRGLLFERAWSAARLIWEMRRQGAPESVGYWKELDSRNAGSYFASVMEVLRAAEVSVVYRTGAPVGRPAHRSSSRRWSARSAARARSGPRFACLRPPSPSGANPPPPATASLQPTR